MFIKLGEIQIKLLIPIIFPIFLQIRKVIREKKIFNNSVYSGFNDFLSLTIFGFLYLIMKYRTKSSKDINVNNNNKKNELKHSNDTDNNEEKKNNNNPPLKHFNPNTRIENINLKKKKAEKVKKFLFALVISYLQLIAIFSQYIWEKKSDELKFYSQTLFQLIYLIIFSKCFLDFSIYSHQIFSFIIILICLLIFFIEIIIYHKVGFNDMILFNMTKLCKQYFYCLSDVLGKKYLITYMDSLYLFLFKIGIIGIIPLTIFGIISLFVNIDEKFHLFQIIIKCNIWIYLLDLFLSCIFELSLWLIIYYFTPCHYIIYETISNFLEIIFDKIIVKKSNVNFSKGQKITFYVLYPFIIFAAFVFNEIIILNFCGLNRNTKNEIMKRGNLDNNNQRDTYFLKIEEDNYWFDITSQNDGDFKV